MEFCLSGRVAIGMFCSRFGALVTPPTNLMKDKMMFTPYSTRPNPFHGRFKGGEVGTTLAPAN